MKKKTCCLCGRKFDGYGNNPWPLAGEDASMEKVCCDECNNKVVLARLEITRNAKQEGGAK